MNTPWFFLSYASIDPDYDALVAQFYSDLVRELRAIVQLNVNDAPDGDIGFFAKTGMGNGTIWPEALASALRKCRVLVCLYSKRYFESGPCGREFTIFNSRIDNWVKEDKTRQRPALIIPVLWVLPKDFPKSLPPALLSIDYKSDFSDALVKARGLYHVKKTDPDEYNKFVSYLAHKIYEVAEPPVAPTLTEIPLFEQVESAFHKGIQITQVAPPTAPRNLKATAISAHRIDLAWGGDSGDKSGFYVERCEGTDCTNFNRVAPDAAYQTIFVDGRLKAKTTYNYRVRAFNQGGYSDYSNTATETTVRDWRLWLYALAAACAIPVLILLIKLIINSSSQQPTNTNTNINSSNRTVVTSTPTVKREDFREGFARSGDPAERKWMLMDEWDLPPQWSAEWGVTPGGWLNVQGMEPGIVKQVFDDFTFDMPPEFAAGAKIGWILRAQGDRQSGYSGYCFVLEPDSDAFRLVSYWGKPQERPASVQTKIVGITEFSEKEGDRIDISGRIEGDTFRFTFKLANLIASDRTRRNKAIVEVSMSGEHPKSGYVGLFAGDNMSRFKINYLEIKHLKSEPPR